MYVIRMYNRLLLFLIIACMALVQGCEYEPKDVYQRKIFDQPEYPVVESVNLDLLADTIYTRYAPYWMFDFSSNQQINSVRFTLDGNEVYQGPSACYIFSFEGKLSGNGLHTLTAEVMVASGTNSIADVVGAEGSVMTKTWVLDVKPQYPAQADAKAKDGYLNITWPIYKGDDFIEYSVYREISSGQVLVTKQTSVGYVDKAYVGEGGRYYVKVNRQQKGDLLWGEINLPYEIPLPKLVVREDNQYYFAWNKSKYYRAVDSYQVFDNNNHSGDNMVKTTQDDNDTTYHITSALFGDNVYYTLHLVPVAGNPNYTPSAYNQYASHNHWSTLGVPLKEANEGNLYTFRQVNADEFVCLQADDTIIR